MGTTAQLTAAAGSRLDGSANLEGLGRSASKNALEALFGRTRETERYYERYQKSYGRHAFYWRIAIGGLSGAATILLGITAPAAAATWLKNLALVATSLVTVLTMLETYRDDRSNYVRMAATFKAFRRLRFAIENHVASGAATREDIERLNSEFLTIQQVHDEAWQDSRQKQRRDSNEQDRNASKDPSPSKDRATASDGERLNGDKAK